MATLGPDTMTGSLSLRSNFAVIHLRVAIRDAMNAYSVEQSNDPQIFGAWFDQMMMYVPVSIISAAAALEAHSNELIKDILDRSAQSQMSESRCLLLNDLRNDRSGNAMAKYRKLALMLDKMPITDSVAWQNADLLFKFRNSFMHFKPAWDSEKDVHDGTLVQNLKQRIPIVPAYMQSFMFPYGFLNYSCAKWGVESARSFSSEFCTLISVQDRFAGTEILP